MIENLGFSNSMKGSASKEPRNKMCRKKKGAAISRASSNTLSNVLLVVDAFFAEMLREHVINNRSVF